MEKASKGKGNRISPRIEGQVCEAMSLDEKVLEKSACSVSPLLHIGLESLGSDR